MNKDLLALVEDYVLGCFRRRGETRLLAREIFDSSAEIANADLVRAFEDLEKRQRALVRHTEEGDDWVTLTPDGARRAGLHARDEDPPAPPHPPRSATKP